MRFLILACSLLILSFSAMSQNIGIGNPTPNFKLDVVSNSSNIMSLNAPNPYIAVYNNNNYKAFLWYNNDHIELGTAVAEPVIISSNYGSIAYFTPNGRVGINTPTPTEVLDVNGKVNLKGIAVNGNSGTIGQVLTSGGSSGTPTWKNLAFANTTRFALTGDEVGTTNGALTQTAVYNTNPADITINQFSITINRSGLYHFDCFLRFTASYFNNWTLGFPPTCSIFLTDGTNRYHGKLSEYMTEVKFVDNVPTPDRYFSIQEKFSYEIYVTAGQTMALNRIMGGISLPGVFTAKSNLTGYLISE